jgi:hypothetical protein
MESSAAAYAGDDPERSNPSRLRRRNLAGDQIEVFSVRQATRTLNLRSRAIVAHCVCQFGQVKFRASAAAAVRFSLAT